MKTPSEELVEVIAPLLEQSKLFLSNDVARHKTKLAAGSMKPEDWLLAVEKAMERESSE